MEAYRCRHYGRHNGRDYCDHKGYIEVCVLDAGETDCMHHELPKTSQESLDVVIRHLLKERI